MEQSPRGDAFEITRVVLEAVRGVRREMAHTNAWTGSFGGTGL